MLADRREPLLQKLLSEQGLALWQRRIAEVGETTAGTEPPETSEPERRPAWICQYRPGDSVRRWTQNVKPGDTIPWKADRNALKAMQPGDAVVYWRTIDPGNAADRGGVVGTGYVAATALKADDREIDRFETTLEQFFESDLIDRDEAIAFAGIDRKVWHGSVFLLPYDQAVKIDELLRQKGKKGLFPTPPERRPDDDVPVRIQRDTPEVEHDALGRAPLAVSLAKTFHEIWCTEQGFKPFPSRQPHDDTAGFVVQVDSPWGGGKTTFANFVALTLNPGLDRKAPAFLRDLYKDRNDMSGLFISATHDLGKLVDPATGTYIWEEQARRPWIVVRFNAWLHQHVEPPWWCFYQTIRKECLRAIRREGVPTVDQDGEGSYRTRREGSFKRYERWLALVAKELWWRASSSKVVFNLLVFLASIGVAWIIHKFGGVTTEGKLNPTSLGDFALLLTFLTGGGSFIIAAVRFISDAMAPSRDSIGERLSLGSGDPLLRFRRHFGRMMRDVERPVLVIIDDLDRCSPAFIVELTRGLQTILLSSRIVFLMLGDRRWIEQAFEVQHKEMSKVDVGPEHTFGGRFVEKAIQLSFVLPALADRQDAYLNEVLLGRPAADAAEATEAMADDRLALRARLAKADTVEAIDRIGAQLEAEGGANRSAPGTEDRYRQIIREEVVLRRATQKDLVEKAIRHRLQPLSAYLPSNPRHIKRIVNAIAIHQESIALSEGTKVGDLRWRQLVLGVVLMMGFPKSWSVLAKDPALADALLKPEAGDDETEGRLAALRANRPLIGLLHKTEFRDTDDGVLPTRIDTDAIQWLNKVIPVNA